VVVFAQQLPDSLGQFLSTPFVCQKVLMIRRGKIGCENERLGVFQCGVDVGSELFTVQTAGKTVGEDQKKAGGFPNFVNGVWNRSLEVLVSATRAGESPKVAPMVVCCASAR